jgi:hypothetical protein
MTMFQQAIQKATPEPTPPDRARAPQARSKGTAAACSAPAGATFDPGPLIDRQCHPSRFDAQRLLFIFTDYVGSAPLAFPTTLRDGHVLRTLEDAGNLIVRLGTARPGHAWDEYAADLLVNAANSGDDDDIKIATLQVQRALQREDMRRRGTARRQTN